MYIAYVIVENGISVMRLNMQRIHIMDYYKANERMTPYWFKSHVLNMSMLSSFEKKNSLILSSRASYCDIACSDLGLKFMSAENKICK